MPAIITRRFAIVDAVIIAAMISGILLTSAWLKSGRPDRVVVFRQNTAVAEYPLDNDAAFTVGGKTGPLNIEIRGGSARILHADCPRQICRRSGKINGPHGQLICAPNNILIQIRSSNDNGVDGIAY